MRRGCWLILLNVMNEISAFSFEDLDLSYLNLFGDKGGGSTFYKLLPYIWKFKSLCNTSSVLSEWTALMETLDVLHFFTSQSLYFVPFCFLWAVISVRVFNCPTLWVNKMFLFLFFHSASLGQIVYNLVKHQYLKVWNFWTFGLRLCGCLLAVEVLFLVVH